MLRRIHAGTLNLDVLDDEGENRLLEYHCYYRLSDYINGKPVHVDVYSSTRKRIETPAICHSRQRGAHRCSTRTRELWRRAVISSAGRANTACSVECAGGVDQARGHRHYRGAGFGKAVVYRGQKKHPLWPPLAALFHTESARFQKILDRTRDSLTNTFGRKIEAIWLFGSVVRNDDLFSSDMDIAVVFNTLPTNETMEKVRTALRQVEEELFVSIAAIGLTRADILRLDREAAPLLDSLKREAIALVGKRPTDLLTETKRASAAA